VKGNERHVDQRLAELRSAFDDTFARPLAQPPRDWVEFVLVVAGGHRYAIRISELAGLEVDRTIVPLPLEAPGLLGLAAVHGGLVPVFELAAILGGDRAKTPARWLALHRDTALIALAFDELEESRRVPVQDVSQAIQTDSGVVHVVDLPSVISKIRQTLHRRLELGKESIGPRSIPSPS
jgi:chemotaxis signal transduction protein